MAVRRLPQLVPQAEAGMCRNAHGYIPPRSTHSFPMLQFGRGSPVNAVLQTPLGWFSGRSIAPVRLRARPVCVGTVGSPRWLNGAMLLGS